MDGVAQTQYQRKLWSSLMVLNPLHPDCRKLDLEAVNTQKGYVPPRFRVDGQHW